MTHIHTYTISIFQIRMGRVKSLFVIELSSQSHFILCFSSWGSWSQRLLTFVRQDTAFEAKVMLRLVTISKAMWHHHHHNHSHHHRHRNQLIGSTVHWPPGSACSRTGRPARDGRLIAMYTDLLIISLILIIEIVIIVAIAVIINDNQQTRNCNHSSTQWY